jgi:hypothetical protein
MLEKVNQLAEQSATNVSRRRFLSRFSGSLAAAGALGTFLAMSLDSSAGRPPKEDCPKGYSWCHWQSACIPKGQRCRESGRSR